MRKQLQAAEVALQRKNAAKACTVEGFFANPPNWLPGQLEKYRANPELHFEPLCAAIAAALDDGGDLRPEDVADEVRLAVQPRTTVVNRHSGQTYDVYIGRGKGGEIPRTGWGMWGNPFEKGKDKDGTRDEVIDQFERYLHGPVENYEGKVFDGRHLMALIPTHIRGKVLGCTCKPADCHGDVLARIADSLTPMPPSV